MRIWFTLNISAVIAKADVSWNGLFIGIWTTLEVSLVFVVACTLCLPKLIQSKGHKFRTALSYALVPFSGVSRIFHRNAGPKEDPTLTSLQRSPNTVQRSSWEDIELDEKGFKCHEDCEHLKWQEKTKEASKGPSSTSHRFFSTVISSGDAQWSGSRLSDSPQDGFQLQQLHTPQLKRQQQQWKSAFSP